MLSICMCCSQGRDDSLLDRLAKPDSPWKGSFRGCSSHASLEAINLEHQITLTGAEPQLQPGQVAPSPANIYSGFMPAAPAQYTGSPESWASKLQPRGCCQRGNRSYSDGEWQTSMLLAAEISCTVRHILCSQFLPRTQQKEHPSPSQPILQLMSGVRKLGQSDQIVSKDIFFWEFFFSQEQRIASLRSLTSVSTHKYQLSFITIDQKKKKERRERIKGGTLEGWGKGKQ